jgi:chromosome segregation ATPase
MLYTSPDLNPSTSIRQLERELNQVKARLDAAKYGNQYNQDHNDVVELERHERELMQRLEELNSTRVNEEEDMQHLRLQVLKYKREKDEVYRKEKEIEDRIRQMERDKEIEKVVMKRMAIEKMKQ